jgi:hypothetical protein
MIVMDQPQSQPQPKPKPVLERNPVTTERHRREVLWQITVPIVAVAVLLLVIALTTAFAMTVQQQSQLADVSVIWLIVPAFFMSLITMLILGAFAYLMIRLIGVLPLYSRQALDYFILAGIKTKEVGNALVEPFLRYEAFKASVRGFGKSVRHK